MAELTAAQRRRLPDSAFALPGRRFPINDRVHQEKALEMAPKSEHAGNISPQDVSTIRSKVARRKSFGQRIGESS